MVLITGCASPQIKKLIFGTSMHDFDIAEKKYTKTVAMEPEDCFKRIYDILKERQATIVKKDAKNNLIVAFGFNDFFKSKLSRDATNTTEVGILLKDTFEGKTEIIVISDNSRLAALVADELFKKIEDK